MRPVRTFIIEKGGADGVLFMYSDRFDLKYYSVSF